VNRKRQAKDREQAAGIGCGQMNEHNRSATIKRDFKKISSIQQGDKTTTGRKAKSHRDIIKTPNGNE